MKLNSVLIKEIVFIIFISVILSIIYNFLSDSRLSLIRTSKELKWESDSTINKILQPVVNDLKRNNLGEDTATKIPADYDKKKDDLKNKESHYIVLTKKNGQFENKSHQLDSVDKFLKNDTISKTIETTPKIVEPIAITIEQAIKLFNSVNPIFIDARTESEYQLGHIKGAISIPWKKFDQFKYKLNEITKSSLIIIYCDGRGCDLSIDLAKKIAELGFLNVKIFYGGWIDWKDKNYPIE